MPTCREVGWVSPSLFSTQKDKKKKKYAKYLIRVQLYEVLELNWEEERKNELYEIQLFH